MEGMEFHFFSDFNRQELPAGIEKNSILAVRKIISDLAETGISFL
jgi:hypothetical protein